MTALRVVLVDDTPDIRLLLNFLRLRGVEWCESSADDLEAYEHWRRRHRENPSRISGAKWARERAAIQLLYGWAHARSFIAVDPSVTRNYAAGDEA